MRKVIIVFIVLVSSISSYGKFIFDRIDLNRVRFIEDSIKSECLGFNKIKVSADFFNGAKENYDYYPLKFKRTNDDFFPGCNVEYYYTDNDSIIHTIVMDWGIMNYVNNLNNDRKLIDDQVGRKDEYFAKYEQFKNKITKLIGKESDNKDISEDSKGYYGETIWDLSDKKVKLSVSFTLKLQEVGKYRFGTFRIRLKTTMKN